VVAGYNMKVFVGYDASLCGGQAPNHTVSHPSKLLIFTAVRTSLLAWINILAATAHCITNYTELPMVFFEFVKLT
jgi:hypothetical protein